MSDFPCAALLFDLDGTLIDSHGSITRVWGAWADRTGVDKAALVASFHGRQRPDIIRQFLPHLNDTEVMEHANTIGLAEQQDLHDVIALPGSAEMLEVLAPHAWTVVTSCDRTLATMRLNAAGLPAPRLLVGADDVQRSKPDPQGYLLAAELLKVKPADCVVLEDAPAGVAAAKAAGMRCIAVRSTNPDHKLAGADLIVDNLSTLKLSRLGLEGSSSESSYSTYRIGIRH